MNDPKQRYNLVRLDRRQRDELLRRLDGGGETKGRPAHSNRRSEPRWPFHAENVMVSIDHPGGGTSEFEVLARNLSCNGIAFIHGGFVHLTTGCRLQLDTIEGQPVPLKGHVVGCRHVEGTLHEVRVRFEKAIDPTLFLSLDKVADDMRPDMLSAIKGELLLVAEADINAALVQHQLESTDIVVTRVVSVEEAHEAGEKQAFDILLFDTPLAGDEHTKHVEQLQGAGLADAVLVVSAETDTDRLKAALTAGADHVLPKPYESKELYVLLSRLLRERTSTRPELTLDAKDGLNEMLLQFIDHAEKMGRQLEAALDEQNLDQARAACLNLKGSAAGFGYAALGDAASDVLRTLDDTMSMDNCLQQITGLSAMCRRVAQSSKGSEPKDGDKKVE